MGEKNDIRVSDTFGAAASNACDICFQQIFNFALKVQNQYGFFTRHIYNILINILYNLN